MCCESDSAEILRRVGCKRTRQRLLVISSLRHAGGHVAAAQILQSARQEDQTINLSTVYRTLTLLGRLELVGETHAGFEALFEWVHGARHHHLKCDRCGAVTKVDDEVTCTFIDGVRNQFDFDVRLIHQTFHGHCQSCAPHSRDTDHHLGCASGSPARFS